jgi:hypothetical protein
MIRIYTESTMREFFVTSMNELRASVSGIDQQVIRQQMGWRKRRWNQFIKGEIDLTIRAEEVYRMRRVLYEFRALNTSVKSSNHARLHPKIKLEVKK